MVNNYLVGIGQDSHVFVDQNTKKNLVLGGLVFPEETGLHGNSDADVILHALFNALSSAIGAKSLGYYSDPMCLQDGITDSKKYLEIIMKEVSKKQYSITNMSISLECRHPKIDKISDKIKVSLSSITGVPVDNIGITATSGEGLTAFGRGEGIQCFVQVLLHKNPTPFYKKPIFLVSISIVIIYFLILYYTLNNLII